jgi:EAL domain-containing protein (putative c-di-GMP-specific phosphodiesterase class I)
LNPLLSIRDLLVQLMGDRLKDCSFGVETGSGVVAEYLGIQLRSAFQPLLTQQGEVKGYEGLLRAETARGRALSPQQVFGLAEHLGEVTTLDRICRCLHLLNFLNDRLPGRLFLNVHPSLHDEEIDHGAVFHQVLDHFEQDPARITLEILESAVLDEARLTRSVQNFQRHGFRIAIDDFGCHHSNLDRLWRLLPDYVKLDESLLREAEDNPMVLKALPHLIQAFHALNVQVIVEGVENARNHGWIFEHGADLGQGFYLGYPTLAGQNHGFGYGV